MCVYCKYFFLGSRYSEQLAWIAGWSPISLSCIPHVAILPMLPTAACLQETENKLSRNDKGCLGPLNFQNGTCKVGFFTILYDEFDTLLIVIFCSVTCFFTIFVCLCLFVPTLPIRLASYGNFTTVGHILYKARPMSKMDY